MKPTRPTTGIALDTSHPKADGTLPLKLRVILERKPRYFGISLELRDGSVIESLTLADLFFIKHKTLDKDNPKLTYSDKKIYKEIGLLLADKEKFANEIIYELRDNFTFYSFKDRFTGIKKIGDEDNVFPYFAKKIKELEANNQFGTASSYDLSLKSLKMFIQSVTGKEPEKLYFKDITVSWLRSYESFMIGEKMTLLPDGKVKIKEGLTKTTVGIYLRPLKAIFNMAIEAKEIDPGVYPFGKKRYNIPKGQKVKKALSKEQLKLLFNATAETPEQEKARDFWFFSYTCNGMNIKDICLLCNENMEIDSLSFFRAKTQNTNKDQQPVNVMLTDFAKSIIKKYRNTDNSPKAFVFPILHQNDSGQTKRMKIQAFTRFINQHIKVLAASVGVTSDISTYFARHSFATLAIQSGASMEYVSEALSHSDIKTTRGYFAGFADTTKKEILEGLMDFLAP